LHYCEYNVVCEVKLNLKP